MWVVCTGNNDHGIVVSHAVSQILAVVAFNLITGSFHFTGVFVFDLPATCTCYDYVAVDVVARVSYFVEHKASYKTTSRVTGALVTAEVVQSLAQVHAGISPYLRLPSWLGLGWSVGAVGEELVSNLMKLLLVE